MVLVERRVDTNNIKVDSAQIVQQQNLTVSLSTVARLSALRGLATLTTTMYLYNHNHKKLNKRRPGLDSRNDVPLKLIQPRVKLFIFQRLRSFPNRLEQQRFRIQLWAGPKDIQNNSKSRPFIPTSDNIAIAKDEYELILNNAFWLEMWI